MGDQAPLKLYSNPFPVASPKKLPLTVSIPASRIFAFMEYVMIVSYGAFHMTSLIDIRHISFMCYPRTCSGECEPLDPFNFAKGSKFEHCRAYEYQQRRTHILWTLYLFWYNALSDVSPDLILAHNFRISCCSLFYMHVICPTSTECFNIILRYILGIWKFSHFYRWFHAYFLIVIFF